MNEKGVVKIKGLKRILILSVTVGAGHMRTAEALKKAAEEADPSSKVLILDTFRYANPFLEKLVLGTYIEIIKISPIIYGYLYRQAERGQPLAGRAKTEFNRILNMLVAPRLVSLINDFQPQIIICTHPFPLGIVSYMKKKGTFRGPLLATITDFTLHSFWVFPEVDIFFTGAEALSFHFDKYRIDRDRVRATGIPIDPAFGKRCDRFELRNELGLAPADPIVLIMGGGLGMGSLEEAVNTLAGSMVDCQLVVVTGTNRPLFDRLSRKAAAMPRRMIVFSYVNNVHQLMAAADLMVGKPGGLSCAEALACGLPLVMVDPLPGQEERNAEFLASTGAAVRVVGNSLAEVVSDCLNDPDRLRQMSAAAAGLGRPGAASDALQVVDELIGRDRLMLSR